MTLVEDETKATVLKTGPLTANGCLSQPPRRVRWRNQPLHVWGEAWLQRVILPEKKHD